MRSFRAPVEGYHQIRSVMVSLGQIYYLLCFIELTSVNYNRASGRQIPLVKLQNSIPIPECGKLRSRTKRNKQHKNRRLPVTDLLLVLDRAVMARGTGDGRRKNTTSLNSLLFLWSVAVPKPFTARDHADKAATDGHHGHICLYSE